MTKANNSARRWLWRTATVLVGASLALTAGARVLDNFNSGKTAWVDSDPMHIPGLPARAVQNGQFVFQLPAVGASYFVNSTKTSESFELKEGRTIEFNVDLVSGLGANSIAVLAWIPTANGADSLAGYALAKSETDILVAKGINKYFHEQTVSLKNNNVTLKLNLKVQNGNVVISSQVFDKDSNSVIFNETYVDTPAKDIFVNGEDDPPQPWITTGNFVLYLYGNTGTDAGYEAIFDNAEVFILDEAVLDDFNDNTKTGWVDSDPMHLPAQLAPPRDEKNQRFEFNLAPVGDPYFINSTKTTKSFELTEGTQHEFRVDMVSGYGNDSFAVLTWIPTSTGADTLAGYGLAKSESDILITKGINKYFYNKNPTPALKNQNVTLVLGLTVKNGNVIIRSRVLDKDDGNKAIFDETFVDTPAADIFEDGTDSPPAPFITTGQVVLYLYGDEGNTQDYYQVIFDNLVASAPPAVGNTAPIISPDFTPINGANFLPASTAITFKANDDQALPDAGFTVTLNGVDYTTSTTPKLTLSGAANARTVTLAGALTANQNYAATLKVTDAGGLTVTQAVSFDTFATSILTVETEDYNFMNGQYYPEPQVSFYMNQPGTEGVDFHDTRVGGQGEDSPYREADPVRMAATYDLPRDKFVGGYPDYDIGDAVAGEWLNYTRDFAAGSYEVYLRVATVNFDQAEGALELVTSDPTQGNQTTRAIGSFISKLSGYSYRNVPLTDAAGAKLVLRLSGPTTLRLKQVTADTSSAVRLQNYLAFLPVADPGVQRAFVASVSPANGATVETVTPQITVAIQNRDTTVKTGTIQLTVNGAVVPATVTPTADGANVTYAMTPLPASGANNTATISFQDNLNATVTSEGSFVVSYLSLDPANRQAGTGKNRGFKVRMVQAQLGTVQINDLQRAEDQLALLLPDPPMVDTSTVLQLVNMTQDEGSQGYFRAPDYPDQLVPGLVPEGSTDDFTVEFQAYLELSAGPHRFGVITDDGYKISSGTSLTAQSPVLGYQNGTSDETFDFVAPAPGIYPFRMIWYERGGGAHAEWFSLNMTTGARTLINDAKSANAVKAFLDLNAPQVKVQSSATVNGTFADDATAIIDTSAKRVTVPMGGAALKFYRLVGGSAFQIKTPQVQGANLVMEYE